MAVKKKRRRVAPVEYAGDPGAIPGINWKQVTPEERKRLEGLIAYYRKKPKPFTACVNDNTKRFGRERAERICAVLKDLIEGGTGWRKGKKMAEVEYPGLFPEIVLTREEIAAVCDAAEAIMDDGDREFFNADQARVPASKPGGGRWTKGSNPSTAKKGETVLWNGKQMTKAQLLARLGETGVPVEAWAWKHKAAAKRLGIPVPATEPTAALKKLRATKSKVKTATTSKRIAGAGRVVSP